MRDTKALRQALAEYLKENGLEAVTAWSEERRLEPGGAVSAVSLRGMEWGAPGFQDYLGERYDEDTEQWEELYGKRVELTFGLDVYAATAEGVHAGVDTLASALAGGGPEGIRAVSFSAGETAYQTEARRYCCPVRAKFQAWAVAAGGEDGTAFLDFEVRGENKA